MLSKIVISFSIFIGLVISECWANPLNLAVILWRGHTEVEDGLRERLKELGYDVHYDYYDAQQAQNTLATLLRNQFESKLLTYDYVYSFGTTASQMTKVWLKQRKPQLFFMTDPVESQIIESFETPNINANGVSAKISTQLRIQTAQKLFPMKKVGVFFNSREHNSTVEGAEISALSQLLNFEIVNLRVTPHSNRLELYLQQLMDGSLQVDTVYFPSDSYLISQAELIGTYLKKSNVYSIGSQEKLIKNGVLFGIVPDYHNEGRNIANRIHRHQNGELFEKMSVPQVTHPKMLLNRKTIDFLKINVPSSLSQQVQYVD